MVIDRLAGDDESLGDLRVAHPRRDQREHLELACGQTGGVPERRRARALAQVPHASLAEVRATRGGRARAQPLQLREAAR